MSDRNYPCDSIIDVYFGKSNFDLVGADVFKKQLWQCMVGQALLIKSDIEARRATNQFGIIVWQLNEIWPTGGWGSIEYGTVGHTKGQVTEHHPTATAQPRALSPSAPDLATHVL